MRFGFVAYHYPRPDQLEDFIERTRVVRDTFLDQPGCRSAQVWFTPDRDAVVTIVDFDSEEAGQRALGVVGGLGDAVAFDDRELKPRVITALIAP